MILVITGYALACAMGVTLGLIGAGGSILTVPILVYCLGVSPVEATAYSLLVVGATAAFGACMYHRRGDIDYRVGSIFAVPALLGVYLTRRFLVPSIPDEIDFLSMVITKDTLIMGVFSLLVLAASILMISSPTPPESDNSSEMLYAGKKLTLIGIEGIIIGVLTGFVGAGGGFMIIPALVMLAGLPMKKAVGTSLLIIAIKSLLGFVGDLQTHIEIDWNLVPYFTVLTLVGMAAGFHFSQYVSHSILKKVFGCLTLIVGVAVIIKELLGA